MKLVFFIRNFNQTKLPHLVQDMNLLVQMRFEEKPLFLRKRTQAYGEEKIKTLTKKIGQVRKP